VVIACVSHNPSKIKMPRLHQPRHLLFNTRMAVTRRQQRLTP
jgi:hypothetical protein